MTNEQAEIQQAAVDYWVLWLRTHRDNRSGPEVLADFHISRSEEERKRIQELGDLLGQAARAVGEVSGPVHERIQVFRLEYSNHIRGLEAEVSRRVVRQRGSADGLRSPSQSKAENRGN